MGRNIAWGIIGGLIPIVANLLVSQGHPLITYFVLIESQNIIGGKSKLIHEVVFYLFQIFCFATLGGIWAVLNKAEDALRAFQLGIAAPAVIVGMVATNEARKLATADTLIELKNENPGRPQLQPGSIEADEFSRLILQPVQFGNFDVSDNLPIEALPTLFSGVERRKASDRLIVLYQSDPQRVLRALVGAIQAESLSTSYRVNIYVARTLRFIEGGWCGTPEQLAAVRTLTTQRSNYRDVTFKDNVDAALQNYDGAACRPRRTYN